MSNSHSDEIGDMKNRSEKIFDQVKAAGASADLIIDLAQSLSLKANGGSLEEHKVSSSQIFGLRVIKDGKVGTAYSEADDDEALSAIVEQALTNASFAAEDEHENIIGLSAELKTDDALLCPDDDSDIDKKIDLVLAMEKSLLAKEKIANVPYNGLSDGQSQRFVFSSSGLSASSKQRHVTAHAYALAQDGDKNAMEGVGQLRRLSSQLDVDAIITEVHENCLAMLEGKPIASNRYDVIFDRECQAQVLGVFTMALSGKSAKDGINPWRDKLGEVVADKRLNLSDMPLLTDGFGYELFDAEGTVCKTTSIIANGKLQTLLHNSATASFFGVETTGHAERGPKTTLSVDAHQIVIDAGDESEASLKAGEYLEITDLTGIHSGANPISGDFSFGASGYLCRDGQRGQCIRGITVAGNFYQMLNKISAIGDEQFWNWSKGVLMPSIRFADMAISGE